MRVGPGWALLALAAVGSAGGCRCAPERAFEPGADRQVIDFHTHISPLALDTAHAVFSRAGVSLAVNLSARPWGFGYDDMLVANKQSKTLLLSMTGLDWRGVDFPSFGEVSAEGVRRAVAVGARGIKIPKTLGLGVETADGTLLPVDDRRLDPVWRVAGELKIPVAIHTGDPLAFFEPPTEKNERYAELKDHPSWSFHGPEYPSLQELLAARDRMAGRHPETTFVAVHVGGFPEDLESVARSMRNLPNLWIDLAARIPEIGREDPESVRAFFEEFYERIVFGTDLQVSSRRMILGSAGDDERPTVEEAVHYYDVHWRYLETRDRDFAHATPIQGDWTISGIGLSRKILDAIYRDNARRLLRLPAE